MLTDLFAFSVAPKIHEALQIAETYMEKTENFNGKVRNFPCEGQYFKAL